MSTIQLEDPVADVADQHAEEKFDPAAVEQFLDLLARMMARRWLRNSRE